MCQATRHDRQAGKKSLLAAVGLQADLIKTRVFFLTYIVTGIMLSNHIVQSTTGNDAREGRTMNERDKWKEYYLEALTAEIINGAKTVSQIHDESANYLGDRTYQFVGYIITPEGLAAGWIYQYPYLKYGGVPYKDAGKSLEAGIIDGHLVLKAQTKTHCG